MTSGRNILLIPSHLPYHQKSLRSFRPKYESSYIFIIIRPNRYSCFPVGFLRVSYPDHVSWEFPWKITLAEPRQRRWLEMCPRDQTPAFAWHFFDTPTAQEKFNLVSKPHLSWKTMIKEIFILKHFDMGNIYLETSWYWKYLSWNIIIWEIFILEHHYIGNIYLGTSLYRTHLSWKIMIEMMFLNLETLSWFGKWAKQKK